MTEKEFLDKFIDYFWQKVFRYQTNLNPERWEEDKNMIKKEIDEYLTLTHKEYYEVEFIKRDHYNEEDHRGFL